MQSSPSVHVTRSNRLLPLLVSPLLPKVGAKLPQRRLAMLSRVPSWRRSMHFCLCTTSQSVLRNWSSDIY